MARKVTKRTAKTEPLGLRADCTALYIRVSTDQQAAEGFSLEAQRERLEARCTSEGWRLCDESIYVDAGESGKSTDRAAFQRMRAAIGDGVIRRVIVTKLDRLSRNTRDFLDFLDYCDKRNCAIVSIAEAFDTGTPVGRAVVTILMAFAELERTQIKDRVLSGKQVNAGAGGYNGAPAPLGYNYDGGKFTANEHAATVRRIYREFLAGSGMKEIADGLTRDQVSTAKGGKWAGATVRFILQNGAYAGISQWAGIEKDANTYPAIVTVAEYEAAVRRLRALKPGKPARVVDNHAGRV